MSIIKKKVIVVTIAVLIVILIGIISLLTAPKTSQRIVISGGGFEVTLKPGMKTQASYEIPPDVRQRFEENLKKAEEAVAAEPNFEHWIDLATARKALGDLWGAAEAYLKAYDLGPGTAFPLDNLSQVLIEMGDYETAEKALLQAKKNIPQNEQVYLHLVDLYKNYLKKSNEEIEAVYLEGIEKSGHPTIAYGLLGFYEETGQKVKAEDLKKKIEKMESNQ
jgi:tetratricopeptide (TPR) repeat protein